MIIVEIDGEQKNISGAGEIHLRDLLANKPYLIEQSGIKMISHPLGFEVNGLPVKVEYSNRRKKLEIVILGKDASVLIKAPFTADRKIMEEFVLENWDWIDVNRKEFLRKIALRNAQNNAADSSPSTAPSSSEESPIVPSPAPRSDFKPTSNPTPSSTNPSSNPDDPTSPLTSDETYMGGYQTFSGSNNNVESQQIDDSKPLLKWEKNGVAVEVIYRDNLKRIKLSIVSPDAHIEIKAPYGTKASKIIQFIEECWPWYIANRPKALKKEIPMYDFNDGAKLPFLGKEYTVRLMLGNRRPMAVIQNDEIVVACNSKAMVETVVYDWYRQNSEKLINELVPRWSKILGIQPPKVEQKFMVNCWGKCYPGQQKIILHPQLIFHPKECFEFIIVHELCHFIESNHSPRFYALLDRYLPGWRKLDEKINEKYILK